MMPKEMKDGKGKLYKSESWMKSLGSTEFLGLRGSNKKDVCDV